MRNRAIINNNPGNITINKSPFRGEIAPSSNYPLKEFKSLSWGYRAMFLILHNFNMLYGANTLDRMIRRWDSPYKKSTSSYIGAIAKRLQRCHKCHIDTLDHDTMIAMVGSMTKIENGVTPNLDEIEEGWSLFIANQMNMA